MDPHTKKKGTYSKPIRFFGAIGFVVFASLLSDVIFLEDHITVLVPLAEAAVILTVSAPFLYFFIYRPLSGIDEERKALSRRVDEQSKRYVAAFRLSGIGKAHIGSDGRIIEANPTLGTILRYTPAELTGKDFVNDLTCREYRETLLDNLEGLLSGNIMNAAFETCLTAQNGKKVWAEATISLIRNKKNVPLYFICQFQDITARKRAVDESRYANRLLEATFAHLHDVVIVVSLPDRKIEMANKAVERIFGYRPEEFVGRNTRVMYSSEDDYEVFGRNMRTAIQESGVYQTEYPMIRKNGEPFPAELYITMIPSTGSEKHTKLVGVIRDLSERERSAREVDEMRHRIESVTQAVTDAMITLDTEGKVVNWSPAAKEMFGFDGEEATGQSLSLILPQANELIANADYRSVATGESMSLPLYATRKDGTEIPVQLNIAPWKIRGRDYLTVIVKDLSALNEAKEKVINSYQSLQSAHEKLQKAYTTMAEKEKLVSIGTLASGVAHEILNPLNIISTIVQTMQLDEWTEEAEENFREIRNQVVRATKITNNLRMFSHKGKNIFEDVDLPKLTAKTLSLIEHDLKVRNIDVKEEYHPDTPIIKADADKLAQVLLNLLNNARDALHDRKGGKLWLSITPTEDGITLTVRDNGPGIPEEIKEKIFDHFFTTKDPDKGTGLGLSVVHNIIHQHGGTITVNSGNSHGPGTAFIITLPLEPPTEQPDNGGGQPLLSRS